MYSHTLVHGKYKGTFCFGCCLIIISMKFQGIQNTYWIGYAATMSDIFLIILPQNLAKTCVTSRYRHIFCFNLIAVVE